MNCWKRKSDFNKTGNWSTTQPWILISQAVKKLKGMIMGHAMGMVCLSILLTTTMFSPAHGQEQKNITSLDGITVYGTRSPQSIFDVPAIVSKIYTDAAGNALAGDIGDLLQFTPGVEIGSGPRRNGQVISIRGFSDESIITLIDNRRQNYESAHDGRFFVDPSLLKSIEVVKGPSSAVYGGGAVAGVVAFETKDAADLLAPGQKFGVLTSFGYRSGNQEFFPIITSYVRTGGWDLLTSVSYRHSGNIKQGDGNELPVEDRVLSGLFKVGYTLNDFHTVKLQAQLLNNDGQEPLNGGSAITKINNVADKKVQDYQFSMKYVFENPDNNFLNPTLHVYYNDTKVEEKDLIGSNKGRVQIRDLNTIGFTADNQSKASIGQTHSHTFSYGFEIYHDKQIGSDTTNSKGERGGVPNAQATNYGFYLQDEIALNTPDVDFLIIPALRFDQYKSHDEKGNSQDAKKVSPKISFSYKPVKQVMLFASWANAFRAPNLTELYMFGQHFPGMPSRRIPTNNFVPNTDLRPETVTTIELGAGVAFDPEERVKIKGSWFTSEGKDFISGDVDIFAGTTKMLNVANAKITGWELEGQYDIHPITAKFGLSYLYAENKDTGKYLSNNVPLTLVTDISYKIDLLNSVFGWRSRFADENNKVGPRDIPTDAYAVHDFYYRLAIESKKLGSMTFDLGVDNVFDTAYTKRFASLIEEGRSFAARLSYKW